MLQFPISKALATERKYPNIVELAVVADILDIELNRRILEFHKSRLIQPHHGRIIFNDSKRYYRSCFSDSTTARAFLERFGGAFYDATIGQSAHVR
jgi:hypothetical protein